MASNTATAVPVGRGVPLLITPAHNKQLMVHTSKHNYHPQQAHVALKSWDGAGDKATTINHITLPSLVSNLRTLKHSSTTLQEETVS